MQRMINQITNPLVNRFIAAGCMLFLIAGCRTKLTPEDFANMPFRTIPVATFPGGNNSSRVSSFKSGDFICFARTGEHYYSDFYCRKPLQAALRIPVAKEYCQEVDFFTNFSMSSGKITVSDTSFRFEMKTNKTGSDDSGNPVTSKKPGSIDNEFRSGANGSYVSLNNNRLRTVGRKTGFDLHSINQAKRNEFIKNSLSILIDYDKYFISRNDFFISLIKENAMDGFYDVDGNYIRKYSAVQNFSQAKILANLQNDPFIPGLFQQSKMVYSSSKNNIELEFKFSLCRVSHNWPGGLLFILLEVKNAGAEEAVNGLVMLNKIPKKTSFVDFVIKNQTNSVSRFYDPVSRIVFWRLNCLLEPGESYSSLYALQVDPWYVCGKPKQKKLAK